MKIGIFDLENGQIEREATSQEKSIREKDVADAEVLRLTKQAEAEAKETARQAILDRLGLTVDEAKLLLG